MMSLQNWPNIVLMGPNEELKIQEDKGFEGAIDRFKVKKNQEMNHKDKTIRGS